MRIFTATATIAALVAHGAASAQLVPEGIHTFGDGSVELCGLSAPDIASFRQRVEADKDFAAVDIGSDRFALFATEDHLRQLSFTLPGEPAHPAVTCRMVTEQGDGTLNIGRGMSCNAERGRCDELFLEFREIDEQVAREIAGQ